MATVPPVPDAVRDALQRLGLEMTPYGVLCLKDRHYIRPGAMLEKHMKGKGHIVDNKRQRCEAGEDIQAVASWYRPENPATSKYADPQWRPIYHGVEGGPEPRWGVLCPHPGCRIHITSEKALTQRRASSSRDPLTNAVKKHERNHHRNEGYFPVPSKEVAFWVVYPYYQAPGVSSTDPDSSVFWRLPPEESTHLTAQAVLSFSDSQDSSAAIASSLESPSLQSSASKLACSERHVAYQLGWLDYVQSLKLPVDVIIWVVRDTPWPAILGQENKALQLPLRFIRAAVTSVLCDASEFLVERPQLADMLKAKQRCIIF